MWKKSLKNCGYEWTFLGANFKNKQPTAPVESDIEKKILLRPVTLPFVVGVSEKMRRAFNTARVATTFKPHRTLKQTLVSLKDKTETECQLSVVYQLKCKDSNATYIGESGRKLGKRMSEHKSKSAVREHVVRCGEPLDRLDWR